MRSFSSRLACLRTFALVGVLCVAAPAAVGENRIVNGGFGQGLSGWLPDVGVNVSHLPDENATDDPSPGAVRIARSDDGDEILGLEQCVEAGDDEVLRISAAVNVPFDQMVLAVGFFAVRWWTSPDCSDPTPLVEEEPFFIASNDKGLAGWIPISNDLEVPVGAQGVSTLLAIGLPIEAGPPEGEAFFDAIFVPEPTSSALALSALVTLCGVTRAWPAGARR